MIFSVLLKILGGDVKVFLGVRKIELGACLFAGLMLMPVHSAIAASSDVMAGRVLSTSGAASVEAVTGSKRVAASGSSVFAGETLVTGADGRMQVKFVDNGLISLRPDTRFRIEEFEFESASGRERSFFSLAKGGFRAVSGRIGKARAEDYRITTPVATLGIRGTDFGAILCVATCAAAFEGVLPGFYARVNQGGIVIRQAGRELFASAGQVVYVKDAATLPVLLSEPPPEAFWSLGDKVGAAVGAGVSVPAVLGGAAIIAVPFAATSGSSNNDSPQSPE